MAVGLRITDVNMLVLGIESSCDDTSVALLDCSKQGCFIISEKTISQIDIHQKYGGVVPEIAGRRHAEKIVPLIEEVLKGQARPDVIAATTGPGLITGLMVGTEAGKCLSFAWNLPLVAVNHIDGHIHSVEIGGKPEIKFPAIILIVSGGHTELILARDHGDYTKLGATKDDAAGECFDKVAKLLGLPYPGGPQISKLAATGKTDAIKFPRPMIGENNFDFSFSGLKTSALYWLRDHKLAALNPNPLGRIFSWLPSYLGQSANSVTINDFAASFEQAIIDVLVHKTLKATDQYQPTTVILAGGVSANKKLRSTLGEKLKEKNPETIYLIPEIKNAMDNAAMIAVAGYHQAEKNNFTSWNKVEADPNWKIA